MKFLCLCQRILRSFIGKNRLLTAFALIISTLAMYCFVGAGVLFLSPYDESNSENNTFYSTSAGNINAEKITDAFSRLPKVYGIYTGNPIISYTTDKSKYPYYETFSVIYPEEVDAVYRYASEDYTLISGRNYTAEEIENYDDSIIVAEGTELEVGEKLKAKINDQEIALNIIGTADKSVIPLSFLQKYDSSAEVLFRFEKEQLSDEEVNTLSEAVGYVTARYNDYDPQIVSYIVYIFVGVMLCIFAAFQVYGVFVYMASKVRYELRTVKIIGCKTGMLTAANLVVIVCYTALSFIIMIIFSPLVQKLFYSFRLYYLPGFQDFFTAFVIYTVIVVTAVLSGMRKLSENLLSGEGETE